MIMPEDMIIDTATADGEVQQIDTEQVVNTGDTDQVLQTTAEQTPQEKTFNQSQLNEIIEKRLEKERQRYESEKATTHQQARDSWIAEQGYVWQGNPITTEAEYKQALKEQELEEKIRSQYSNVPDEIVNEILEGKKFREQTEAEKAAIAEEKAKAEEQKELQARTTTMYEEFLKEFPDQNTEEAWKAIPKEVFAEADKWLKSGGKEGRRLADAFIYHQRKAELQQQQIQQANNKNAETSTGSVKNVTKPKTQDPFLEGFDSVR